MMNWLKPSIDAKAVDIFNDFVENEIEFYDFMKTLENQDKALELESVYLLSVRRAIHDAYEKGVEDALNIIK